MSRVAAIAIDAAEWWYLERLLAAGHLPNLARLRARGAEVRLRNEVAYRSELVWARFLSGREPIEDKDWAVSITFDPATYGLGKNTASTATPFYAGDLDVVALDLIHSYPAPGVRGPQVVGWGAHSPQWPRTSAPAGLLTEIDRRFGVNPAFDNDFDYGWHDPEFIDALTSACVVGASRRTDIARWLLEQNPGWELFLTCVSELHSMGHQMWHGVDPRHPLHGVAPTAERAGARMRQISAAVDAEVGRLVEAVGEDTTVVVFAMHGFQPADDLVSTVLMPELFSRLHLGRALLRDPDQRAWRAAGCPPVIPRPDQHIGSMVAGAFADGPKQRLRRAMAAAVPGSAFAMLRRAAGRPVPAPLAAMSHVTPPEANGDLEARLEALREGPEYEVAAWYRPHWARMPYFALPSFADGHVRVNLAGRERDGMVDPVDYGRTLDAAERILGECRDARTGLPIVADVLRMRADDPFDPDGPDADLLVIFDGAPDAIEHPTVGTIGPFPHLRAAHHSPDGFALMAGPGVTPGDLGVRSAADLGPTILGLLGRPTPAGMKGSALLAPV
jgi:predicted AlkP superfamily phosphohydrolase/phosphomutase